MAYSEAAKGADYAADEPAPPQARRGQVPDAEEHNRGGEGGTSLKTAASNGLSTIVPSVISVDEPALISVASAAKAASERWQSCGCCYRACGPGLLVRGRTTVLPPKLPPDGAEQNGTRRFTVRSVSWKIKAVRYRTELDGTAPRGFQDRCLKPLGHPSRGAKLSVFAGADICHGFDLDLERRVCQRRDLDQRRGREIAGEGFAPCLPHLFTLRDVGDKDGDFEDVRHTAAGGFD